MTTRKERVSNAFMMIRKNIKSGADAQAHQVLIRLIESEIKKSNKK